MKTRRRIIDAILKSESWKDFVERTVREADRQILEGTKR